MLFMLCCIYNKSVHGSDSGHYMLVQDAFTPEELEALRQFNLETGIKINDRDIQPNSAFVHEVWRVEKSLEDTLPSVYGKLQDLLSTGIKYWRVQNFSSNRHFEIEYIVYDVKKHNRPPQFSSHVDNDSLITIIVLLSKEDEYGGGIFRFVENKTPTIGFGDVLMFRGEELEHGVSPVEFGRRVVLQLEFAEDFTGNARFDSVEEYLQKYEI